MEKPPFGVGVHDLDQNFSHIGGYYHKKDHNHYCVHLSISREYSFDGIFSEGSWGEGGQCSCWKLLTIDVLVVPGPCDQAQGVAGIIGQPIVSWIWAIVIGIIENNVDSNEDAGAVVADHQNITEKYD